MVPADVGLATGSRRRIGGLRREEVAFLAGISVTWYVYLEQARDVQPSRELLDSLARVLRLNEDERRYMHRLAHGSVGTGIPLPAEISPVDTVEQIVGLSSDSLYPVYACDHYCDLLAWNPASCEWYGNWDEMRAPNLLSWMFADPVARERLADWELEAQDMVARWRSESARHPDDARIQEQVAELGRLHPEFDDWWKHHEVLEHRAGLRGFRHPRFGLQTLRVVPLLSPEFSPTGIALHLPVPSGLAGGAAGLVELDPVFPYDLPAS